jgi:SAM-dependent methyltransferase
LREASIDDFTFTVNSIPFDTVNVNLPRPDLGHLVWYDDKAHHCGFECELPNPPSLLLDCDFLEFSLVDKQTRTAVSEFHSFFLPLRNLNSQPMPDAERRRRVHGSADEDSFILTGFSSYMKMQRVLEQQLQRTFKDYSNILDWGCGCGRVLRYLSDIGHETNIVGVDIDQDNVEWCQENYSFGDFQSVPLFPPTRFAENSFDLVIGLSVFTHLNKKVQFKWLRELNRLVVPGGVLLLTTLGPDAISRAGLGIWAFSKWQRQGILEAGKNHDLKGYISDRWYYINTIHSHSYIKSAWGKFFQVINIIPGCIGNQQDLIVLRKPLL